MTWYLEWFGEDYLDLYSHRDDTEARKHAAFVKERFGPIDGLLLDLACGTGRHIRELHSHGYRPVGCDLSYTMLRTGIENYGVMAVVRADMRALPFGAGAFAGLVNFFTSFGYFDVESENLTVVREMARVLRSGAPFLFDYLNVHRELENLVERESRETPRGLVQIERWFDASDRSFNKRIAMGQRRYLERVRGYDLDEISAMFTSCSLKIGDAFGDFDGSRFDKRSPRLILMGSRT